MQKGDGTLRVIVIDGVAGIGKTLLIRRIAFDRSQSYKSGNPLLLHVELLGSVLTAINDRIAVTLFHPRASFNEEELKPLIRRGLIQLCIDGFNELFDSRGYNRAWGALRGFIRDLDGKGTCILAGRDTMLNERTVKEGLGTSIGDHPLIFMKLQEPEADDIRGWLSDNPVWRGNGEALDLIYKKATDVSFMTRPFFVSLVSEMGPDRFMESGGEPLVYLMDNMIERESEKIVPDSAEVDIVRVRELYTEVLAEVARTMMDDETDSIEIELLERIVEEAFNELDEETINAVKGRAGALAMLEQDKADPNSRMFPHEVIKSYFFSKSSAMTDIIKQEIDDLRLFADPFEDFSCDLDESEKRWEATLIRNGRELTLVRSPGGKIVLRPKGDTPEEFEDFRALLVSETFANLERLARALNYQTRRDIYDNGVRKNFITSRAEINIGGNKHEDVSFDEVSELLLDGRDGTLRVIIIDGVAGIGKTLLIRRIVFDRSQSYKSGNPLLLHVESLGKVLTALDDRIAGTLSGMRASFGGEELKALIRRGLIQLCIDGFDELSDSAGYETAWGALRDFLRDLDGKGTCILAGRDTMLNERTVKEGLGTSIGDRPLIFMMLQYPSSDDIGEWLSLNTGWSDDREALRQIENQAEQIEYIRRPLFVSLVSRMGPDRFMESGGEPLVYLMDNMIEREGEKIVPNSAEVDIVRVRKLYTEVLAEVARTMMDDETDRIELDWLALIIEEAFTGEMNREAIEAIKNRAGTLAMLERNKADPESRMFPHETIKSYFFSKSIVDYFPKHGPTKALSRIFLHMEDFSTFNKVVRIESLKSQRNLRIALLKAYSEMDTDCIRANIGSILLSYLPLENDLPEDDRGLVLSQLSLQDAWIGDLTGVQRGELVGCQINRLDVRGADLSGVEFHDVTVFQLLADDYVKLGETVPKVFALTRPSMKTEFDPDSISDWLSSKKSKLPKRPATGMADKRWSLLERFARLSMRRYWLRESDRETERLMRSPYWPELKELLKKHNRLVENDHMHMSGPRSAFLHLVNAYEFLNPDEPQETRAQKTRGSTREILRELGFQSYLG